MQFDTDKKAAKHTDPDTEAPLDGVGGKHDLDLGGLGRNLCQLPLQPLPELGEQGCATCIAGYV